MYVDQDRVAESELFDAACDLRNLRIAMRAGVARVWDQRFDGCIFFIGGHFHTFSLNRSCILVYIMRVIIRTSEAQHRLVIRLRLRLRRRVISAQDRDNPRIREPVFLGQFVE